MPFGTRTRLGLALITLAAALATPRTAAAGCTVTEKTNTNLPAPTLDVRVLGDTAKQAAVLEIRNDGSYHLTVDCNNNGIPGETGDVDTTGTGPAEGFSLELGGSDSVTILLVDDLVGAARSVAVTLAGVNNTVSFNSQGHGILSHSDLAIEVNGSAAIDAVTLNFQGSTVDSSSVVVRGDLGLGGDSLQIYPPATTKAAELDLGIDLNRGLSTVTFDDNGGLLDNGSTLALELRGSNLSTDTDAVTTTFSGKLEGGSRVDLDLRLNGGNDRYTGNFNVSSFGVDTLGASGSEARYYVHGGPGFDRLAVNSTGTGAAVDNGLIEIRMEGFTQPDTLSLDWEGLKGSGTFRLRANSTDASDIIIASLSTDPASANVLDMVICTDSEGDLTYTGDTALLTVVDYGSASLGPAGGVIVDGGLDGIDYCTFFGNVPHLALNCEAGAY